MKKGFMLASLVIQFTVAGAQWTDYSNYPVYTGSDLGLQYSAGESSFRVWSPTASEMQLSLYTEGLGGTAYKVLAMKKAGKGIWAVSVEGDLEGKFYTYRVRINGDWRQEVVDPYAKAVGVNGKRAMVIDLRKTDPDGWSADQPPAFKQATDAIIYELHIRDASIALNSGVRQKGKFLGLAEKGTTNTAGLSTGLDHFKELGVTHIHLLPFFDFLSVDETKPDRPQYNWGYEPLNYDAPEGSYASNPYDGVSRIRELKEMIKAFHENGLRVVMDVVYNHTMLTEDSWFNQLVPGYYYRQTDGGKFSNATACGNETASERPMMRKFIVESLEYWAKEYHIDGFRFDLMGVHDITTMNLAAKKLRKINPGILLYGEGWTAGVSPLPESERALKANAARLDDIAVFSDDLRDGIKGSVFVNNEKGFASGKPGMEESIKFGVLASCAHPQVDYTRINYSKAPYSRNPSNTVSYAECHDNHVLWDKLALSVPEATDEERKEMHKLALSIVLTSQGISFLHAGTEFLRSKKGHENSYNAGDSINAIDWDLKTKNRDIFEYVKALVDLRKAHPAFRMRTGLQLKQNISFLNDTGGLIAYTINGRAVKDSWHTILVAYNGNRRNSSLTLPAGKWQQFLLPGQAFELPDNNKVLLPASSCSIFFQAGK